MLKRRKNKVMPPVVGCPLKACLSVLGGAWTPNIIWYLKDNARRFSELKDDIDGVSGKVLTDRLRRLEKDGIVDRNVVPSSPPTVEYSLSKLGKELLPAIDAIVRVGEKLQSWHDRK